MDSRITVIALLLAVADSGCTAGGRGVSVSIPLPAPTLLESRTVVNAVPDRPGLLTREQFERVSPLIRALRADPAELIQNAGDTVRVTNLVRVIALDSAGSELGEIPFYDFSYTGRGFRLLADGRVHLRRRGTVRFTARMPARMWTGREEDRPSALVALKVE